MAVADGAWAGGATSGMDGVMPSGVRAWSSPLGKSAVGEECAETGPVVGAAGGESPQAPAATATHNKREAAMPAAGARDFSIGRAF